MKTITYYEVSDGNGYIGKDSNYHFETQQDAVDMITAFKNNPTSHNEKMTDENIAYWKNKTYSVIKKTIITETVFTL